MMSGLIEPCLEAEGFGVRMESDSVGWLNSSIAEMVDFLRSRGILIFFK